jgi:hypothetical protein
VKDKKNTGEGKGNIVVTIRVILRLGAKSLATIPPNYCVGRAVSVGAYTNSQSYLSLKYVVFKSIYTLFRYLPLHLCSPLKSLYFNFVTYFEKDIKNRIL